MSSDRRRFELAGALPWRAFVWVLASVAVSPAMFSQTRIGSEFQVNSYTVSLQGESSVASDAAGNFVVVWNSDGQDGSDYGVFAQRFSSTGAALGDELQVNVFTTDSEWRSSVAVDAAGDFVISWQSFGGQDGEQSGVFARRFSSSGAALADELQVNSFTPSSQTTPAVTGEPDGDFVVVWWSSANFDLFAQRFSSAGGPLGGEFQVNTYTTSDQRYPSVALVPGGGFVVVWESYYQDLSYSGVVAQRFSSEGAPIGGEIQVNTYTENRQGNAVVAVHADGGFVVAWDSYLQDGYGGGVFARRFSSAGDPVNGEIQINAYTEGGEVRPALVSTPDGGFIVAWETYDEPTGEGVFARRYSSEGLALADEFQVNSYTDYAGEPSIAIDGAGNFVVAWTSYGRADVFDIFAQRFALTAPPTVELDIDGDGQTEALTDGLLVLRRLFLFTGATLTTGAVDTQNCTRCDAAAIEPYIAGLGLALDIDGDGAVEPLSDGILVLRYLFGFTGATLTSGAVDTQNCTRCDAAAIEPYLLGLTS